MSNLSASRLLVVDDDPSIRRALQKAFIASGHDVTLCSDVEAAALQLESQQFDVILTDLIMPGRDGMDLMRKLRSTHFPGEIIIMTGHGSIGQAVAAIREGAYDFIEKPFDLFTIRRAVDKALQTIRLRRENDQLRKRLESVGQTVFVGHHPRMQAVIELVKQVAPTRASVLLQGESGTGKGQIAKMIHDLSGRRKEPFVHLNCGALPETLLETELFGHERGAFTDAVEARPGRFEQAQGGTLFLDEVAEMSPRMQVKLLRVLQEMQFERVGGNRTISVDVRIVSATNTNIDVAVQQGTFREDLYYRLNVINVYLPALRERGDDVRLLATHFLDEFSRRNAKPIEGFEPEVLQAFDKYNWPGNIRELQNSIERAVILTRHGRIRASDLPGRILFPPLAIDKSSVTQPSRPGGVPPPSIEIPFGTRLSEATRLYLNQTIDRLGGSKKTAAEVLGVNLRTLYRKI